MVSARVLVTVPVFLQLYEYLSVRTIVQFYPVQTSRDATGTGKDMHTIVLGYAHMHMHTYPGG